MMTYAGRGDVIRKCAPRAKDFTQQKDNRYRKLSNEERSRNRNKSRVRAKVEHLFGVIKRQFGFNKVRYRGLDKNAHYVFVTCALANMVIAKRCLLRRSGLISQAQCA